MSTAVLATALITLTICVFIGFLVFMHIVTNRKKNNIDVVMRFYTEGKPMVDYQRARIINTKMYGEVIFFPKLNKAFTRIDQEFYLPSVKNGRFFIDVTMKDGYMYVNKATKKLEYKEIKKDFNPNHYDVLDRVINPVPYVDRMQAIQSQKMLTEMTERKKGWLSSPVLVIGLTLIICAAIFITSIVLAQTHAQNIVEATLGQTESSSIISDAADAIARKGQEDIEQQEDNDRGPPR